MMSWITDSHSRIYSPSPVRLVCPACYRIVREGEQISSPFAAKRTEGATHQVKAKEEEVQRDENTKDLQGHLQWISCRENLNTGNQSDFPMKIMGCSSYSFSLKPIN